MGLASCLDCIGVQLWYVHRGAVDAVHRISSCGEWTVRGDMAPFVVRGVVTASGGPPRIGSCAADNVPRTGVERDNVPRTGVEIADGGDVPSPSRPQSCVETGEGESASFSLSLLVSVMSSDVISDHDP